MKVFPEEVEEFELGAGYLTAVSKQLRSLGNFTQKCEEAVLLFSIWVLFLMQIANVMARKFFQSIYFTEEIGLFLIFVITFFGISYAVRKARHVRMSAISDFFPKKIVKPWILIMSLVSSLVMFYAAYVAVLYILHVAGLGRITPALMCPYWIFLVSLPVGFSLAGIQYVRTFSKNISEKEVWVSAERKTEYGDENNPLKKSELC